MRKINIFKVLAAGVIVYGMSSCKSSDIEFPDYTEQTVYFAYQTPVRTIVLGMDDLGSTADNDTRACKIYSTMGGTYNGGKYNIKVDIAVDNSLCDNLYFDQACTNPVLPMPSSHYQLGGSVIEYQGEKGYVDVQLTDAFFADPKSYQAQYVIPVVMKSQTGATRILSGELQEGVSSANRFDLSSWFVKPQDYVLYCVRYISKYHGYYLPQGTVTTSAEGGVKMNSKIYKYPNWESVPSENVVYLYTRGENTVALDLIATLGAESYNISALLTFNGNTCTITSNDPDFKITGTGTYTEKSPSYNWGQKDRDGLKIQFKAEGKGVVVDVDYDMALQRRGSGNTVEEFNVTLKK